MFNAFRYVRFYSVRKFFLLWDSVLVLTLPFSCFCFSVFGFFNACSTLLFFVVFLHSSSFFSFLKIFLVYQITFVFLPHPSDTIFFLLFSSVKVVQRWRDRLFFVPLWSCFILFSLATSPLLALHSFKQVFCLLFSLSHQLPLHYENISTVAPNLTIGLKTYLFFDVLLKIFNFYQSSCPLSHQDILAPCFFSLILLEGME